MQLEPLVHLGFVGPFRSLGSLGPQLEFRIFKEITIMWYLFEILMRKFQKISQSFQGRVAGELQDSIIKIGEVRPKINTEHF